MSTKVIAAGIVVIVVLLGGLAGAVLTGVGPAPGGDSGGEVTDFPTATPGSGGGSGDSTSGGGSDGGSGGGSADTATATAIADFDFVIDRIEECGDTCRDVTSTITNQQDTDATGVTVYSRVFAGNQTNSDDRVWSGKEEVGTLPAGESYTATKRVELSLSEAYSVRQADGWITIQTTIQTDDQTITFVSRRNVL